MEAEEQKSKTKKICDLNYLNETMNGKKHLIREIIDLFLTQTPQELTSMNNAIKQNDFEAIKGFAHTMKSSITIMGITEMLPILQEMEDMGEASTDMERTKELNRKLNLICSQAMEELEVEKLRYI